jgi:hypothetical protein
MAPRRGPDQYHSTNDLSEIGTIEDPTQCQCFSPSVSQTPRADFEDKGRLGVGLAPFSQPSAGNPPQTKNGVRQSTLPIVHGPAPSPSSSPLAPPSNRLIAQLNENWRVVDDPLQWILQRRHGNPRKKNSGWDDRSFCTTREGLLRHIRERCGQVDQAALAAISALPADHSMQNLDVRRTDQHRVDEISDPLAYGQITVDEPPTQDPHHSSSALY